MTPVSLRSVEISAPFRAAGEHVAIDLGAASAVFTTRRGGFSSAPYDTLNLGFLTEDAPESVAANREAVASQLGVGLAFGRQVHGSDVAVATEPTDRSRGLADVDGQATATPGVGVIVLTADCLPIAVCGEGGVAMIHAGWRGLVAGILERGVETLRDIGVRGPLTAAIGPGAGVCCYEVGDEVHAALGSRPSARRGRHADLKAVAARRLRDAGVDEVHDVRMCTICGDPGWFFSHRRDHGRTGRQAGIAWLN